MKFIIRFLLGPSWAGTGLELSLIISFIPSLGLLGVEGYNFINLYCAFWQREGEQTTNFLMSVSSRMPSAQNSSSFTGQEWGHSEGNICPCLSSFQPCCPQCQAVQGIQWLIKHLSMDRMPALKPSLGFSPSTLERGPLQIVPMQSSLLFLVPLISSVMYLIKSI